MFQMHLEISKEENAAHDDAVTSTATRSFEAPRKGSMESCKKCRQNLSANLLWLTLRLPTRRKLVQTLALFLLEACDTCKLQC